ncbi:hypothetical protein DSECCO2_506670 [anaerobic digester metagenome]
MEPRRFWQKECIVPIYIAPTSATGSPTFSRAEATRLFIDSAAFSVKVNAIMLSGLAPSCISRAILNDKVLDFPEPAQAKHKISFVSSMTALYWSSVKDISVAVKVSRNSGMITIFQ